MPQSDYTQTIGIRGKNMDLLNVFGASTLTSCEPRPEHSFNNYLNGKIAFAVDKSS